jgi:hypothetical protein
MRSFFLLMAAILVSCYSFAQTCDCKSEFLWVKAFMEKNHPGYNSDIKLLTNLPTRSSPMN